MANDKKIIYLPDAYAFLQYTEATAREKIIYNIRKIRLGLNDATIFKKLQGTNIWEFRTLHAGKCYRMLAFWDTRTDTLIVATHGFVKKTQKTPSKEIAKAEILRKKYFEND